MGLGEWIGIVGVVATVAFGLPALLIARRDGSTASAYPGGINIQQVQSTFRVCDSHDTHHHFHGSTNQTDEWDEIVAWIVGVFVLASIFWLIRPYLVVLLAGLLVGVGVLTLVGHHWVPGTESRSHWFPLIGSFVVLGIDLLLLAYPGLTWGSGWQLRWTFSLALHAHGPGFVAEPLLVLFATVGGMAILFIRSVGPVVAIFRLRSTKPGRIKAWARIETEIVSIGWRSSTPWFVFGLAVFGLIIAVGFPYFGAGHVGRIVNTSTLR